MQQLNAQTTTQPRESAQPTIYSGMKTQCDFHVYTNYISNRLLTPSGISVDEAIRLNETLEKWTKTLPAYFHLDVDAAGGDNNSDSNIQGTAAASDMNRKDWYLFSRARLWWRIWNLQIILFRHILLRRATSRSSSSSSRTQYERGGGDTGTGSASSMMPSELEMRCRSIAVEAARNTIKSVHDFLGQVRVTRLINWYAT
jgi:transcriptional regulatory protein GAL4